MKTNNNVFRGLLCLILALALLCPAAVFGSAAPLVATASAADYTYTYYPKYTGSSKSIVDALKAVGVNSSFSNRKAIAALNGYSSYTGTAAQNTALSLSPRFP